MNLEYKHLLPMDFSPNSRVWIYQCSRLFTISEALEIEDRIKRFTDDWQSHGDDVKAYGTLFFGQFIILMADEVQTGVSGCSTDASVRFIKSIGEAYSVDLFNRTTLAFLVKNKVELIPVAQMAYAFENNFITEDTLYFNNLAATKKELENTWIIPVKQSWLASRLPVSSSSDSNS